VLFERDVALDTIEFCETIEVLEMVERIDASDALGRLCGYIKADASDY
jgi:hypothetical protein